MKSLQEIGIKKAFNFVFYSLISGLLKIIVFPQARSAIICLLGGRVGGDTIIGNASFANLYHYGFHRLRIGDRCFIGDEAMLDVRGGIILENDVTLSNRTNVVTHINVGYDDHPLQVLYPTAEAKVVFKKGAYVGTAATILPGNTIGVESIVAAGAVVTKNVVGKTVVGGVPARVIKSIK